MKPVVLEREQLSKKNDKRAILPSERPPRTTSVRLTQDTDPKNDSRILAKSQKSHRHTLSKPIRSSSTAARVPSLLFVPYLFEDEEERELSFRISLFVLAHFFV